MYKVVNKNFKNWNNHKYGKALVCLEDPYGGQSVIATDDHCYMLFNGSDNRKFKPTKHWYKEASLALLHYLMGKISSGKRDNVF